MGCIMPQFKSIDATTASDWLSDHEAILIDVREPDEYKEMHIADAHLIPMNTIDCNNLPDARNKKIIVHCRLGKRGGVVCEKLLTENPNLDIYNLEGGIIAWENAGFKIVK